ncbi:MAG: hypothetical protein AAF502_06460 [Bacteroidota bacterium]
MTEEKQKERKNIEIGLGLFTGYIIAGLANMMIFDKSWQEAFSDVKILMGIAGIALSLLLYKAMKKE